MIGVDISNVWGAVSLPEFLALEAEVAAAYEEMGKTALEAVDTEQLLQAAQRIREDSQVCVVLGSDSGAAAARGVLELLPEKGGDLKLVFAGSSLSTRQWNGLLEQLEGRSFSVIVVSSCGEGREWAIALRGLRWMLERKLGTDKAGKRIYAVTASGDTPLGRMAKEAGWELFCCGSALTAALLPMAAGGIDVEGVLQGAAETAEDWAEASLENPLWQYAAVRSLLRRSGRTLELISCWEPRFRSFGRWWRQCFASAGDRGLLPVFLELPRESCCAQQRAFLETAVRFAPPEQKHLIGSQWNDPDGLNYLEGKTLDQVEEQDFLDTVDAHTAAGIPVLTLECGDLTEQTLGQLLRFVELSGRLSAAVGDGRPAEDL